MKKAICTFIVDDSVPDKERFKQFVSYYHVSPPEPLWKPVDRKFIVEIPINDDEDLNSLNPEKVEKLCAPLFKERHYMLTSVQLEEFKGE